MNSYFKQLRQEMRGNPYQKRFLEELEEHTQDLKEDDSSKKSLNLNDLKKHFGEPSEVKKTFISITQPWKRWQEVGEALGYGILIVFWLSLSPMIGLLQGPYYHLTYLAAFLLVVIPYLFIWPRLLGRKDRLLPKKSIVPLVILPSLFASIASVFRVLSDHPQASFGFGMEIDVYATVTFGSVIIGFISAFFFPLKKRFSLNKKCIKFIPKTLGIVFFLYFMAYAVFRMLGHPFDFYFSFGVDDFRWINFWDAFFLLAYYIESGLLIFLPSSLFASIHLIHVFQILMILTLFVGPIIYFVMKKHFSWRAFTAFVYALFFIVIPQTHLAESQDPYFNPIHIHVPYANVSQMVEQKQYGLFYNTMHYLAKRFGGGFAYKIDLVDGQFVIRQSSTYYSFTDYINASMNDIRENDIGQAFLLNEDKEDGSIQKTEIEISFDDFPKDNLSGSLSCKGEPREFSLIFCKDLFFKHQLIMSHFTEFPIPDFVFSKDEAQLLIATHEGVYLLDLTSLQSNP